MDFVDAHDHQFNLESWPFRDPTNTVAISTKQVFEHNFAILRVSHDADGDWQILCDTTSDINDAIVVCLGCAYERDNSIGILYDLPLGWSAWRENANSEWILEKNNESED